MESARMALDETRLIGLLERQRALYGRLSFLADRQKALVMQEDARTLLSLLSDRQKLVDALGSLNNELAPYREQWTAFYGRMGDAPRRQVAALLEEANQALCLILQNDSRDTATLSARRQDVSGRLATVDAGSRASAAYATSGAIGSAAITDAKA